jgi:hypothetical protein
VSVSPVTPGTRPEFFFIGNRKRHNSFSNNYLSC